MRDAFLMSLFALSRAGVSFSISGWYHAGQEAWQHWSHPDCPPPAPAVPPPPPPGCPSVAGGHYSPLDTSAESPAELDGCPVTVSGLQDESTSVFFKLRRPSPTARLRYSWNWNVHSPPKVVLGFGDGAYDDAHGECAQWSIHEPGGAASHFGEVTWFEDAEDARDVYHCQSSCSCATYCGAGSDQNSASTCIGPYGHTNGGFLYITITGKYLRETTAGWVSFEFVTPVASIDGAQLEALRSIWLSNCWPTLRLMPVFDAAAEQPNKHWSRRHHMGGKYSLDRPQSDYRHRSVFASRGQETDSDAIPFCDVSPPAATPRTTAPATPAATPPATAHAADATTHAVQAR